ncbi:unnamed protein product [Ilex paraguariensis]|uniref:Transmembrane protein n=1 Tax=Ilex paraguariensis TaxID=185542 RepID=A0ABC8UKC0_9AQUA
MLCLRRVHLIRLKEDSKCLWYGPIGCPLANVVTWMTWCGIMNGCVKEYAMVVVVTIVVLQLVGGSVVVEPMVES